MTTDEESNFDTLVTSPSATSFDINFEEHDKDLSSLNCDDLFPNPPKYIPDTDQISNHGLNSSLECEAFAGFSDDTSKTSPDYTNSNDNDIMQLKLNMEDENSYSNSHSNDDRFNEDNEKYMEEDNTTQNSSMSVYKSYEQTSLYGENDIDEQHNEEESEMINDDNSKKSKSDDVTNEMKIDQNSISLGIENTQQKKRIKHENFDHPNSRVQNHQLDTVMKIEDKHLPRTAINTLLPASSPSLSLSSYYSSAESVSSDTTSKKKKKRHCHTCDIHFRHTRDLLKHLRIHVTMPSVIVTKLNESDINCKTFFKRQQVNRKESTENIEHRSNNNNNNNNNNSGSSNNNINNSSGSLKLKLKLSGSQNFEVVPIDKKSPSSNSSPSPVEEKSKKAGGIRVLKAQEIKLSPPSTPAVPPIDAMAAMTQMSAKQSPSHNSLENRYFECPTFDISEQFNEEISHEATEDLLKKLLESNSQQTPQETDWSTNTNEFISIDRLAHICTVCHKSFSDGIGLYEHKRLTGHDFNNSMHPPPPPKNSTSMTQQYSSMRHSLPAQHMQMGMNQSYPSHTVPNPSQLSAQHSHSQHLQHPSQLSSHHHSSQHSSQHLQHHPLQHPLSHLPSQHSSHAQMSALGMRSGYPGCGSQSSQRPYSVLPPNYAQSPQMVARRPPPLYRVQSPQNIPPGTPPFGEHNINQDLYYPSNSSAMMNGRIPSPGPYPNGQIPNMARPPVFLKARLQRAIRPKSHSPNGSLSPPVVMSPQQITRPKFLGPPYSGPQLISPQLCSSQLRNNSQTVNGDPLIAPPLKKIKRETDDCEVVAMQPRIDGLPVIQSVQGGASLQDSLEKSKDGLQLNDQITLSLKNKESNKNPKEVANILANRGITITHKPKNGMAQEENPNNKSSLTQEAVQKLQLNNSVSIISKKKNETNGSGNNCNVNDDSIRMSSSSPSSSSSSSKHGGGECPFISCSVPDCEEKFLTQESLNRHIQRGHRMNKMNLKAFRCKICPALFSTQEGLIDHQRRTHRLMKTSADELGIPIIDLRNEQTKQKLAALGIINYIPLNCKGTNGCFGFPIVSVQGAANPNVCNVLGMGINSLLSLGPIKPIPTKKSDL